jgi:outer membrane protein assembly factor BamB
VAEDGTIYVASRSTRLHALNPDGTKKWSFELEGETDSSPAVASDGTIYVGSGSRPETPFRVGGAVGASSPHARLWAVNPDGTKKWEFATGDTVSSAAVASDGTVYVQGDALYAIGADGVQKWRLPVGRGVTIGGPAIGRDGTVYVCGVGGSVHAVTPNGRVAWEFKTRAKAWMRCSPAVAVDGTVYVYATGVLYAIRPDGSEKWTVETRGGAAQSTPAIAKDGTVYVRFGGELCAIDPTGREKWRSMLGAVPPGSGYEGSFAVPAVGGDGTVYIDGFQRRMILCAIDPAGKRKWSLPGHGGVASSPAIGADGTIYFGTADGELVAVGEAE